MNNIALTIILFLALHTVMDFFCQTDKMAQFKSKSGKWLLFHVAIYSLPFFVFGFSFGVFIFATHLIVDFVTSRITAYFYREEKRHWFFVTIGVDQWIHQVLIIAGIFIYLI